MKHSSVGMALTNAYHPRPIEEPRFLSAFSISMRFSLLNTTVLDQNQQKSKRTQRAPTRTWPLSLYIQNLRNVMNCRRASKTSSTTTSSGLRSFKSLPQIRCQTSSKSQTVNVLLILNNRKAVKYQSSRCAL